MWPCRFLVVLCLGTTTTTATGETDVTTTAADGLSDAIDLISGGQGTTTQTTSTTDVSTTTLALTTTTTEAPAADTTTTTTRKLDVFQILARGILGFVQDQMNNVTTTSTTSPPEGAMLVHGVLRFTSSADFRVSDLQAQVSLAFRRGLANTITVAVRGADHIELEFSTLSDRRQRRLSTSMQAEYWVKCQHFWQAMDVRDELNATTTSDAAMQNLSTTLNQELQRLNLIIEVRLQGHFVNKTVASKPPEPTICPPGWTIQEIHGWCMGQGGIMASSGFVHDAGCCSVCTDAEEYAPIDGRKECSACTAFREVNSAGNGCTLSMGPLGILAVASILGVALLCGCGPLLPPSWLWMLDAWDVRRRGVPCRCGRGKECTCDHWKGNLSLFFRHCNGSTRMPQGHWVLHRVGVRVSGGLCPRCSRENMSEGGCGYNNGTSQEVYNKQDKLKSTVSGTISSQCSTVASQQDYWNDRGVIDDAEFEAEDDDVCVVTTTTTEKHL